MQWLRSFFQRGIPQIPHDMWQDCVDVLPFLRRLSVAEQTQLKTLCEQLLSEKTFTGAGGFTLSDEIAVRIAVQACLPVLHLTLRLYDDMAGIIVYPSEFVVPRTETDDAGVVHEWREPVSGEAIDAGGAVVLSWEDAQDSETPGYNVVIHEFTHKIDMKSGAANGCPPFLPDYHGEIDPREWQSAFAAAYDDFAGFLESEEEASPEEAALSDEEWLDSLPLDPYAASHPAEFFAVASEAFFIRPAPLQAAYPEVFHLLERYYRQYPLAG